MCWCNRKYHCWRGNFQLLTKCSHSFSEVSTLSLKNHRKHASERDGDKDRAQLTGHWLCRCDLFSLLLGLEYHPLDPLTGICNWVGAAVRAAARPECRAAGAPLIRQGAAGELHSGLCTSHHLQELQHDVNLLGEFKANVGLMLWPLRQGWSGHFCCCCTSLSYSSRKHSLLITIAPRRHPLSACRIPCWVPAISDSFHQYHMFLHWLSCPPHPEFTLLRSHGAKSALCFITHGTSSDRWSRPLWQRTD